MWPKNEVGFAYIVLYIVIESHHDSITSGIWRSGLLLQSGEHLDITMCNSSP